MAFVNEFVSEEEIAKYDLDALMKKYNPRGWKWGRPPGFKHHWTIDRHKSTFLLMLRRNSVVGPSGNPEPGSERLVWFSIGGRDLYFEVDRPLGGSTRTDEVPFRVLWKIKKVDSQIHQKPEETSVTSLLREALTVYGDCGAWTQIPNTVVTFVD